MNKKEEELSTQEDAKEAILTVDIGTTNLKCCLYDTSMELINMNSLKVTSLHPNDGYSELDPAHLMNTFTEAVHSTIKKLKNYRIKCFGLSTQRNSFILWNRLTGENYTKIILWNDRRPVDRCKSLNGSVMLNTVRKATSIASLVFANERYRSVAKYKVEIYHIAPKLYDQLKILENKLSDKDYSNVVYGTIETWLVWNLSREKNFVTDITSASCSGFYDIYVGRWSDTLLYLLDIPKNILPSVRDNCDNFGNLTKEFLGYAHDVPIESIIGDSQAAFVAECAFNPGDCVITIGTGSFISVNVGSKPLSSDGSYPLAGVKYKNGQIYIIHSPVSSAGIAINWAKSIDLFQKYEELENILHSTTSSNGVYFIPAFGFLEVDQGEKTSVGTGFIGLKASTTKHQMVKAIFDSIAYSIKLRLEMVVRDLRHHGIPLRSIRISGGVSKSDAVCQFLANILELPIERSNFSAISSAYGAAFLAGLGSKMFHDLRDLNNYRKVETIFKPDNEVIVRNNHFYDDFAQWKNALHRFIDWYKPR